MGPQAFEKAWRKQLTDFSEVKIFFRHIDSETIVQYIDGDQLIGVRMFRDQYYIDLWLGHFQHYLDTGKWDTKAYWVTYKSALKEGNLVANYQSNAKAIQMALKSRLWVVHSPEHNQHMKDVRAEIGDCGFKQIGRVSPVIQPHI
tara:strand:- start:65977 stop:66411 length:435 start_codon:yes stop_codon:yes gene_type:complete